MSTEPLRYPLSWPEAKPRTPAHERTYSPFGREPNHKPTVDKCRRQLAFEMHRLGVGEYLLSTNLPLRLDGEPRSGQRAPDDPGVAVYFQLNGRPTVLACDRWGSVAENMRAIVKHIDAIRGMDRWGVASTEQMFLGNAALPAPGQHSARSWRSVLNFGEGSTLKWDEVVERYRNLARLAIGDDAQLRELNVARDEARKEFGG